MLSPALQVDVADDSDERWTSVGPSMTVAFAKVKIFGACW